MHTITIINPALSDDAPPRALAPQLADLRGARIAFVDNSKVNADLFIGRVQSLLGEHYGVAAAGTARKLAPKDDLTDADLAWLTQCDAVIQCLGD